MVNSVKNLNPFYVFLFSISIYLFTAAGFVDTLDSDASIQTSVSLLERGSFQIFPTETVPAVHFIDSRGRVFSKVGILMPILYLPVCLVAKAIPLDEPFKSERALPFLISLVNPVISALLIALMAVFIRTQPWSLGLQRMVILSIALGTLLFPYSKTCSREPIQALLLFISFFAVSRNSPRYGLAGVALSLGLFAKQAFFVPAFPLLVLATWQCYQSRQYRALFTLLAPILFSVGIWLVFNHHIYGTFYSTGYSKQVMTFSPRVWNTPFWEGIHRQLFALDSGLWIFSPLVIIPILNLLIRFRSVTAFELCVLTSFFFQCAFYASWPFPTGAQSLGPRYLVTVLPLLVFLLKDFSNTLLPVRWVRPALWILVLFSVCFQFFHSSIKPQQYFTLRQRAVSSLSVPHPFANVTFFVHKLFQKPERYNETDFGGSPSHIVDLLDVTTLQSFNFWWLHLWHYKKKAWNGNIPLQAPIQTILKTKRDHLALSGLQIDHIV